MTEHQADTEAVPQSSEHKRLTQEQILRNLKSIDTSTIDGDDRADERAHLHDQAYRFLEGLSEEAFYSRFGSRPKTAEGYKAIIDTFLYGNNRPLKLIALIIEDELIGACSIFQHDVRDNPVDGTIVDTDHVVELSFTVADAYQKQGIGTTLLAAAADSAANMGKSHVYASFDRGNRRSQKIFNDVLGRMHIAAGFRDPTVKYYRIRIIDRNNPDINNESLELVMRKYCGDEVPAEQPGTTEPHPHPNGSNVTKMGRQVLETLSSFFRH